ncbi:MAG: lamin tail domain-containing protein [Bacteroidota bacterium]
MHNVRMVGKPAWMLLAFLLISVPRTARTQIVISQIYGGGGNSGAPFSNDFIELFNQGQDPVSVDGWSVQYASATGSTWQSTPLSGEVLPHQWFLIQESGGSAGNGASLPTPDVTGTFGMSVTGGKVALLDTIGGLSGACPSSAHVVGLVGWGTATCFEGAGPAPGTSNTTALMRRDSGMATSRDNAQDFVVAPPDPRNSGSAPLPVKVVLFRALAMDDSTVEITWTTISEVNNFGFYVERRLASENDYVELAGSFCPGFGSTLVRHDYQYIDSPALAESFYRLRQVDLDGTEHYTEATQVTPLMSVRRGATTGLVTLANWPNPFNPTTTIRAQWSATCDVKLVVFDLLGREIVTLADGRYPAGVYAFQFDADGLSSGVYLCRLSAGNFIETRAMIMAK